MPIRRIGGVVAAGVWLLPVLFAPAAFAASSLATSQAPSRGGQPNAPAEKRELEGVPNFGRASETLYRGGQPEDKAYRKLKELGIEIVVSFRDEKGKVEAERRAVEALGMRFVSIPWSGWNKPKNRQVAEFLGLLRANPGRKIFVHCRRGAERTGVMLAAWRIAEQQWTPEQALGEMKAFRFRAFWFRHLKTYVRNFPKQLQADPRLRAFEPTLHPNP